MKAETAERVVEHLAQWIKEGRGQDEYKRLLTLEKGIEKDIETLEKMLGCAQELQESCFTSIKGAYYDNMPYMARVLIERLDEATEERYFYNALTRAMNACCL